jgi:hypothetical protein
MKITLLLLSMFCCSATQAQWPIIDGTKKDSLVLAFGPGDTVYTSYLYQTDSLWMAGITGKPHFSVPVSAAAL